MHRLHLRAQISKSRVVLAVVAVVTATIFVQQCGRPNQPHIILWAWERPENLEFINLREMAVAFLAKTIRLRAEEIVVRPRLQPLKFALGTELIAVVRIEAEHPALSHTQLDAAVSAILELAQQPNVSGIQIDFDASQSEREFYREMLQTLRRQLRAKIRLSITALASWCIHDDWITGLPIDEAVPMLFRMGVEANEVRSYLAAGKAFRCRLCQKSLGVSVDEPLFPVVAMTPDRVYVFNPQPWSAASVNKVLKEWRK